jgi:hypothetical protein
LVTSAKSGYVYQIDYPVFRPEDSTIVQYGVLKYKPGTSEIAELGRFDTREVAVKVCEDDISTNP